MDNLIIDFNPQASLEIQIRQNTWVSVTPDMFRSWGGERRINGQPYQGPVYMLWTNEVSIQKQPVLQTA